MGIPVVVVQHGEKMPGAGDPGLSDAGVSQACTVARWLQTNCRDIRSVWTSPLKRSCQTAAPIAAAFGFPVRIDVRLRERMNWDDGARITLEEFLAEWERASQERTYTPAVGDSSHDAAARFLGAIVDIGRTTHDGTVVVVAHGGVTVDALRTLVGDAALDDASPGLIATGVLFGAITRLTVDGAAVSVEAFPSTDHLDQTQWCLP